MDTGEADGDGGDAGEGGYRGDAGEGGYTDGGGAVGNGDGGGLSGGGVDGARAPLEEPAQGPAENSAEAVDPRGPDEGVVAQGGFEQERMGAETAVAQQAVPPPGFAVGTAAFAAPDRDAEAGAVPPSLGKHPRSDGELFGASADGFGGGANGGGANGSGANGSTGAERRSVDGQLDDGGSSGGNASKRRRAEGGGAIPVDTAANHAPANPPLVTPAGLNVPAGEPEAAATVTASAAAPVAPGIASANGGNGNHTSPEAEAPNGHGDIAPETNEVSVERVQAVGGAVRAIATAAVPAAVASEKEEGKAVDEGGRDWAPNDHDDGDGGVGGEGGGGGGGGSVALAQPEERLGCGSVLEGKLLPEKSREAGAAITGGGGGGSGALPAVEVPPENGHPPSAAAAAAAAATAVSSPAGTPPAQEMASNRALDIMVRTKYKSSCSDFV